MLLTSCVLFRKLSVRYSCLFQCLTDLSNPGEHSSSFCVNKLKCAWPCGDFLRMGMSMHIQLQGRLGFVCFFFPGVNISVSGLKVSWKYVATGAYNISCLSHGYNEILS